MHKIKTKKINPSNKIQNQLHRNLLKSMCSVQRAKTVIKSQSKPTTALSFPTKLHLFLFQHVTSLIFYNLSQVSVH